ncbi:MAG: hypothetical protein WC447_02545 [Candidatus Paceibacterota bacterium]|jgi:hypothetical protein
MEKPNIEGQQINKEVLETKKTAKEMRGKIIYNFRDGSVGVFDSLEELTKALGAERENYN